MRATSATLAVVAVLLSKPNGRHWGYEIGKLAHLRSGALYPILHRMLDRGWLSDGWEDDPEAKGRPPRRYYSVTDAGLRELGAMQARASLRNHVPRTTWAPGIGSTP